MPDHVIATNPIALLSLVPELVGFEPHESLVLLALRGKAVVGTFRIDLPSRHVGSSGAEARDAEDAESPRDYAIALVDTVRRLPRVDGVIPVVNTDASCKPEPPHHVTVEALRTAATAAQLRMPDALYIACDGWGRYTGESRPRDELDAAISLRRLDPDAPPIDASPREAATLPVVSDRERSRTTAALAAVDASEPVVDPVWLAQYCGEWHASDIGPASAALMAALLRHPSARDVLLCTWAWGSKAGHRAARFQDRYLRGRPTVDGRLAAAFSGAATLGRPDVQRVEHAITVLREVAARLDDGERAAALSALAWLSWALGRGSVAGEYVRQALLADPGYGLAMLLDGILQHGILPEWAFAAGSPSALGGSFSVGTAAKIR